MLPETAIIILNWNGREHLQTCLRSVFNQSYKNFIIYFVDNGSGDDSLDFVREHYSQVEIIVNKKNVGFAEGNNVGIRQALQDGNIRYVVTLNNDTEVTEKWLAELIKCAETDKTIGAVSSKMLFFDQREVIDSTGDYLWPGSLKVVARGYRQADRGQYDKEEECFAARAGAALYRREMLEDVRLGSDYFDKIFFAYIEDVDLSIRSRLRGWKIIYAPRAVVYHKVAATTKKISYMFRRYHAGRNRLFTAIKNYPILWWPAALAARESVDSGYQLNVAENIRVYLRISASLIWHLPRLLFQRRIIRRRRTISYNKIKQWRKRFSLPRTAD